MITGANKLECPGCIREGFSETKALILQGNKSEEVTKFFFIRRSVAEVLHGCNLRSLSTDHQSVVIVTTNTGPLPQSWHVPSDAHDIWDT